MSQKTSVVLTDAASTPVNRTFGPAKKDGDAYRWDYRGGGIGAGFDRLTINTRLPTKALKATKVSLKLETPILEVTSPSTTTGIQPAPTVSHTPLFEMHFVLPEKASLQERKNLLAMARDLIDEALVTESVENLDPTYF